MSSKELKQNDSQNGIKEPNSAERRIDQRFTVNLNTSVKSENYFFVHQAENLSIGGVFLASKKLLPIGKRMELNIQLPDRARDIIVIGEVRWVRHPSASPLASPPGMGVMFQNLSERDRQSIENYLAWQEPALEFE